MYLFENKIHSNTIGTQCSKMIPDLALVEKKLELMIIIKNFCVCAFHYLSQQIMPHVTHSLVNLISDPEENSTIKHKKEIYALLLRTTIVFIPLCQFTSKICTGEILLIGSIYYTRFDWNAFN